MTRKHIHNPTVTLLMQTCGGHQHKIGRAVRSFLDQAYRDCYLLIVNTHPAPLTFAAGTPRNVLIHNVRDIFTRPVEQHMYSEGLVFTDCWSILDDDDSIASNHVQQLVEFWNTVESRTEKPLQVISPHIMACYPNGAKEMDCAGWMCSLFERLTREEIAYVYKLFPANLICGDDSWIATNTYFDRREFDGRRTYYWDRCGASHVSAHETRNEGKIDDHYWYARNYWKLKLEAQAAELRPVDLGKENDE